MRALAAAVFGCLLVSSFCNAERAKGDPSTWKAIASYAVSAEGGEGLTLHRGGEFVAASGGDGTVRVWKVGEADNPASFRVHETEDYDALVVLLGRPCIAVAGVLPRHQLEDHVFTFADCATGNVLGRLTPVRYDPTRPLMNLVALESCGLVAARFEHSVVLMDVEQRVVRADRGLFAGPVKEIATSSGDDQCLLYGVTYPAQDGSRDWAAGNMVEFDLRNGTRRVVGPVVDRAKIRQVGDGIVDWIAVSPSGREVSVSSYNSMLGEGRGGNELRMMRVKDGSVGFRSWLAFGGLVSSFEYLDEDRILASADGKIWEFDGRTNRLAPLGDLRANGQDFHYASVAPSVRRVALVGERLQIFEFGR